MFVDDIENIGFGFVKDKVSDPEPYTVTSFVSVADNRPNIFLFHRSFDNSFSLRYRDENHRFPNNFIANDFVCNTKEELKEFLSKFKCFK